MLVITMSWGCIHDTSKASTCSQENRLRTLENVLPCPYHMDWPLSCSWACDGICAIGFAKPCFYQGHVFPSVLAWLGNSGVGRNATSAVSCILHASTVVHNSRFDTTCATCELMCPYRTAMQTTWQQTEEPGANKRLQSHQVQSAVSWEYSTVMSPWPWSSLVTQEQSPNPLWRLCSSGLLEALNFNLYPWRIPEISLEKHGKGSHRWPLKTAWVMRDALRRSTTMPPGCTLARWAVLSMSSLGSLLRFWAELRGWNWCWLRIDWAILRGYFSGHFLWTANIHSTSELPQWPTKLHLTWDRQILNTGGFNPVEQYHYNISQFQAWVQIEAKNIKKWKT